MNCDKIVRDHIPEIIRIHNRNFAIREVNDYEATKYLIKKIHEETDELDRAFIDDSEGGGVVEELADILECVHAIALTKTLS